MWGDLREEKGEGNGFRGGDLGVREGGGSMSDWGFLCVFYVLGNLEEVLKMGRRTVLLIKLVIPRINRGIEIRVWFE